MKYQFNKTSMQRLERDLNVRRRALPTLKSKETALRLEVKKAQESLEKFENLLKDLENMQAKNIMLWSEYPELLTIDKISVEEQNIAGVKIPILENILWSIPKAGLFHQRAWVVKGTEILKEFVRLNIEIKLHQKSMRILYNARKKTTQKVNLYEKVQIPAYKEAIRRIKSFLDDQENLSRATQKIAKKRAMATAEGKHD